MASTEQRRIWIYIVSSALLVFAMLTMFRSLQEDFSDVEDILCEAPYPGGGVHYYAYKDFMPSRFKVSKENAEAYQHSNDPLSLNFLQEVLEQEQQRYNRNFRCYFPSEEKTLKQRLFCSCKSSDGYSCPELNPWKVIDVAQWRVREEAEAWVFERTFMATSERAKLIRKRVIEEAKTLFKNTAYVDLAWHNNQVLDVVDSVDDLRGRAAEVKIKDLHTLVHFDSHSDMYLHSKLEGENGHSIADYISLMLSNNNINEVYWVLPDWTKDYAFSHIFWDEEHIDNRDVGKMYLRGPKSMPIYVLGNGELSYQEPGDDVAYHKVMYHKVLISELPNLSKKKVFLDFDLDYLSNVGCETDGYAGNNPSEFEFFSRMGIAFETLIDRSVFPDVATFTLSPGYTSDEDLFLSKDFFDEMFRSIGKEDMLASYYHNYTEGHEDGHRDVLRKENFYKLMWDLDVIDARSSKPDGFLSLEEGSEDLALLKKRFNSFSKRDALLKWFDQEDGEEDQQIDIDPIDENLHSPDPLPEFQKAFGIEPI